MNSVSFHILQENEDYETTFKGSGLGGHKVFISVLMEKLRFY